jgi:hypothetical protein
MPRRAAPFTQADVSRAIKGAASAGVKVERVEIMPDGRIVLVAGGEAPKPASLPFDAWAEKRRAS